MKASCAVPSKCAQLTDEEAMGFIKKADEILREYDCSPEENGRKK